MQVRKLYLTGIAVCIGVWLLLYRSLSLESTNRNEIVRLSENYVKILAQRQANLRADGPYFEDETAYDLKKTLAVLLEDILRRLARLEKQLDANVDAKRSIDEQVDKPIGAKDLIEGAQDHCEMEANWRETHPNCEAKLKWMSEFWRTDNCYALLGVDGSECSFVIYLSEIESHCPRLSWRPTYITGTAANNSDETDYVTEQFDLSLLFNLMTDNIKNYDWIQNRIRNMWPRWLSAFEALRDRHRSRLNLLDKRKKRKIVIHMGFLSKETNLKMSEKAGQGGPLGELVQWSDTIAALHLLGHDLYISSEQNTVLNYVKMDPAYKSSCPMPATKQTIDYIYTDIMGLRQLKRKLGSNYNNLKCKIRVLDSFGTQAPFNSASYFNAHKSELGGKKNPWGGHKLLLPQFYTMYPHTTDNTFLGFVVDINNQSASDFDVERQHWALVYGKEAYMWVNKTQYLQRLANKVQVHATVRKETDFKLPDFVINHEVLTGVQFHQMLRKVKIFFGMGFPYEGPAPLEAISNGAIFINPIFKQPKGRLTDTFFGDKPTLRQLASQNPYAQDYIGEPFAISVDYDDDKALDAAIDRALRFKIEPHLPFEFTVAGMLERLLLLTHHQQLCEQKFDWPPPNAIKIKLSKPYQSCDEVCFENDLRCEPSVFARVNVEILNQTICKDATISKEENIYAPAVHNSRCVQQQSPYMFSCAFGHAEYRRLCPCRTFVKDQVQVCQECYRL